MKENDGHERKIDLTHPDDWMMSVEPHIGTRSEEDDGPGDDEDDERDAIAVIVWCSPVVAFWIHVLNHVGGCVVKLG